MERLDPTPSEALSTKPGYPHQLKEAASRFFPFVVHVPCEKLYDLLIRLAGILERRMRWSSPPPLSARIADGQVKHTTDADFLLFRATPSRVLSCFPS
jgi:hypothetical protein